MRFSARLRNFLFGKEAKKYRDLVHESNNALQASYSASRKVRKSGEEAFRVAQEAIRMLEERGKDNKPK